MFAVVDDVDTQVELLPDDVGNGILDLVCERRAVVLAASVLGIERRGHAGPPRQAADVSGANPVVAFLHGPILSVIYTRAVERPAGRFIAARFRRSAACSVQTGTSAFTKAVNGSLGR